MNYEFKYFKNNRGTLFYKIFRVCPNSPYMMNMCAPRYGGTWMRKSAFKVEENPLRVFASNKRTFQQEELIPISEKEFNNHMMMLELQK